MQVCLRIGAIALVVLISSIPFGAEAAQATNTHGTNQTAPEQSGTNRFSDAQLKKFVAAQKAVQSAMKRWDAYIDATNDASKKKALRGEENHQMAKAVTANGLKPKIYNQIAEQAKQDPKLTRRIQSFMSPSR